MTGLGPNDGSVYQVSDGEKTQVGQGDTRHLINMPRIPTESIIYKRSSSSRFATLHLCHAHLHVVLHLLFHPHFNAIEISCKLFYVFVYVSVHLCSSIPYTQSSKYGMIKLCCQKDSTKTIAYLFICKFELFLGLFCTFQSKHTKYCCILSALGTKSYSAIKNVLVAIQTVTLSISKALRKKTKKKLDKHPNQHRRSQFYVSGGIVTPILPKRFVCLTRLPFLLTKSYKNPNVEIKWGDYTVFIQ
ncbi:hypothetical protein EDC96DRAFT_569029 [Choanephora cucurbitarum]|nr:hypothetical protein EDC96DRAFT_569029 [Choanephora cucurbitarum]